MGKKKESLTQMRVLRIEIDKNHKMYNKIDNWCFLSKNLYNRTLYVLKNYWSATKKLHDNEDKEEGEKIELHENEKEVLEFVNSFITNEDKQLKTAWYGKIITNFTLNSLLKNDENFKAMKSESSLAIIKQVSTVFESHFKALSDWVKHKDKYTGRPKLPKYKKKDGRFNFIMGKNQCKIRDGVLTFTSRGDKDMANYSFNVPLKDYERNHSKDCDLREIKFVKENNVYAMYITYKIEDRPQFKEKKGRVMGIDIGVSRLVTCSNTIGEKPFCINGNPLKSYNKEYNKKKSKLQTILKTVNNEYSSKRLRSLDQNRNNRMKTYMHQTSSYIVKWCVENDIDTIVIGSNKGWKQECELGKETQTFIQIPFDILKSQIKYKANSYGIEVIEQEESYTSGTSFIDNEEPVKENYNKSRRVKRGLFKSNGVSIHSDLNGAYQIIRKAFPEFMYDGTQDLHPVVVAPN